MTREDYSLKLQEIQIDYPHLSVVETNDSINGYPSGIREALIGFKNMDEANEVAKKYFTSCNVYLLDRPEGHHFYTRRGDCAWDGIDVQSIVSDDYELYSGSGQQYLKDWIDNIKGFIDDIENYIDTVRTLLNSQVLPICEDIDNLADDEMMILREGEYYDTVKKQPTEFSYDSHCYAIGVLEL
jgi:hypothetical protein